MPATRGRRNPALLEQQPADQPVTPSGYHRQFFCGRKPLTYLGDLYRPGERMPDSVGHKMPRLDTRIRQGLIHVQFAPEGQEAPPPVPEAAPSTGLAEAMRANLAHAAATDRKRGRDDGDVGGDGELRLNPEPDQPGE